MPSIRHASRRRWTLVLLFSTAFGLRIGYMAARGTLGVSPSPERGYREYVIAGQRLLRYGTITGPLILDDADRRPSALMPPAYVALVAGTYAIFGVETRTATLFLHLVNAAATSLVVVLVFLLAGELAGSRAAWIAAIVATINPTLIGFSDFLWDTNLFAFGAAVAVWWSHRLGVVFRARSGSAGTATEGLRPAIEPLPLPAPSASSFTKWFPFGLYLGVLAMLNPALSSAYPLLVLWPIVRRRVKQWRDVAKPVALTVAGWAIALTPWTIRNHVHFNQWIYVRGGLGMELWLGSCPEADGRSAPVFQAQFPLNNAEIQRHVAQIGERAYIQECGAKAKEAISADPWRFVRLSTVRFVDYLLGTSISHADNSSQRILTARNAITAFLAAEAALIALAILLRGRGSADLWWLFGMFMAFGLVYALTHAQVRFRAPIESIVAVVVAVGLRGSTRLTRRGVRR
jgi:hypothetical protein